MSKPHRLEWDDSTTAAVNARLLLPPLVTHYFATVRGLLAKDPAPPELHQLRLATKRLRYTLELFRSCYGPGLETRVSELREIQQLLGEVNDSAAAGRLLAKAASEPGQHSEVDKFLTERAEHKAKKFRKHWNEVFDAAGREQWWTGYLQRESRAPSRRA